MGLLQWLKSLFGKPPSEAEKISVDGFCIIDSQCFYHTGESIPKQKERKEIK